MKLFLVLAVILLAVIAGGYFYLVNGLRQERLIQAYYGSLGSIVARAIQLERTGSMWSIQLVQDYHDGLPPSYKAARTTIRELHLSGGEVSCDLDVALEPIDLDKFLPNLDVYLSYFPLHYVSFFYGKPPDMSPFLESEIEKRLVGPVLFKGEVHPRYGERGGLLNGYDISDDAAIIQRAYPNGLTWHSKECSQYSYIEIKGN